MSITISTNSGTIRKSINDLETNLNNTSTTLTNKINTTISNELDPIKNRLNIVETEVTPIARGGTGSNNAEQACINFGAIGYRTGLQSGLSGISGFFWADSSSGIPTNQIPSGYENYDWSIIQFAAKTGVDKTQIFSNAGELFIRGDDTGNGQETWTQSSWKKLTYVQDTYRSGTTWYRVWNDGWIELGANVARVFTGTVTFPKSFTQVPTVMCGCVYNRASTFYAREVYPNTVSTTGFTITNSIPAGSTSDYIRYYACGY